MVLDAVAPTDRAHPKHPNIPATGRRELTKGTKTVLARCLLEGTMMMEVSNYGAHSTQSEHYRTLASEAMESAAKTQTPVMRDGYLKLAAGWVDLAAEADFVKH